MWRSLLCRQHAKWVFKPDRVPGGRELSCPGGLSIDLAVRQVRVEGELGCHIPVGGLALSIRAGAVLGAGGAGRGQVKK